MYRFQMPGLLLLVFLLTPPAQADYSTDQVQMAATGRFDLLEKSIEEYAVSHPLTSRDLHALCYAYSKTKHYTPLLDCLAKLEERIRAGDRRTRLFGLADATPAVHIMRAEAFLELGRYPEAIGEATKAAAWLRQEESDDLDMVFNALAALSIARTLSGDEEGGKQAENEIRATELSLFSDYVHSRAFALARSRMALKNYAGVIDVLQSDTSFAIKVFLDRLVSGSFLTGVNNWVWVELPRAYMIHKALLETGQVSEAKAGLDRLLEIPEARENGEIYWLLLFDRGCIADDEGSLETALSYYQQAIDIVERQRATIHTEASKIGFVGEKQALYYHLVDLVLRLDRPLLAFEYIERSKSRALVDLLAERERQRPFAARDANSQRLLDAYREAEDRAVAQLPLNMSGKPPGDRRFIASRHSEPLRAGAPELASLLTVNALTAEQLRRHIGPDEVLIEYFGFGNALYGIAVRGHETLLQRLDGRQVEAEIREFRTLIEQRSPAATALARRLYQQLVKPFESLIGNHNLLVVPHGALHYLPFSALNDGRNWLVSSRSLRLLPSLSAQEYLRPSRSRSLDGMLLYGNPDLGNKALDLPAAESEVRAIASLVPNSRIFTRQAASESSFRKEAGSTRYLHVASHGEFKSDQALESRLLLAGDAENDGSLTVREIYDLRLDADLVTLSACQTGLGTVLSGDDLVGLTRGFFYAGSSNVIATLWEVSDEATATLMKQFYSRLKAGKSKRDALREAQLHLEKIDPHPFFWAAFYLTGNGV